MPQSRIAAAQKIARELLDQGLVEPARSDWNAPVLLVPKKDGTWCFAIDFRKVNALTRMDPTGIPHAKLALHALGGNRFFSLHGHVGLVLAATPGGDRPEVHGVLDAWRRTAAVDSPAHGASE